MRISLTRCYLTSN